MKGLIIGLFSVASVALIACGNTNEETTTTITTTTTTAPVQTGKAVLLSVAEFKSKLGEEDVQLIDVRRDWEVEEGKIENAVNMDVADWDAFVSSASGLDKTKPVLVYCKAGGRSAMAAEYLAEEGFQVFDLDGGYTAWSK